MHFIINIRFNICKEGNAGDKGRIFLQFAYIYSTLYFIPKEIADREID